MKFSGFFAPRSLSLLNLHVKVKAGGCPRCRYPSAVVVHGSLLGYAASGDEKVSRGSRYLCSNRYSNKGCGGTFSVHWDTVIPYCSIRTVQLLALIRTVATGPTIHGAWYSSGLRIPIGSLYRWVTKWRNLTAHIRAMLCQLVTPPGRTDGRPDPFTLRHLSTAFPEADCTIAAFQNHFQTAITK